MAKVLHVSKFFKPFNGGIERVVDQLSEGALSKGHEVRVVCCKHVNQLPSTEVIDGVSVFRFRSLFQIASQPIVPSYFLRLRSHLMWADYIYVHTPNPLVEFAILLLAPKKSKIFILHHSDIIRQKFIRKIISPIRNLFYKRAEKIIVATENHITYSDICSRFRDKTEVIPFGLDLKSDPTHSVENDGKYALFVGRLVGYKGLEFLIQSMQKVDGELIIVGEGPLEKTSVDMVKNLGLEAKVKFLGNIGQYQLNQVYQKCCFLVLPSVSSAENFGLVQLEAMSFGKPVISTSIKSGASTIVEDGVTGFIVAPENSDALADKMNQLFRYPLLAKGMGKRGYERLVKLYSLSQMLEMHQSLIDQYESSGIDSQKEDVA